MLQKTILLIFTFSLISCSIFPQRVRERKIQSEIISKISVKAPNLSNCASDHKIFAHFKEDRIRVVLSISINNKGLVEKFKLDDKPYNEDFVECMFKVIDLISFPKIKNHELIELEQPFIFSKK
ncbi:MAG: hypothetical protein ACJAS4_000891 [Bacteriovoracaceae bacterium]|jgi:hypothetical protein